jgi:hypothetical protein
MVVVNRLPKLSLHSARFRRARRGERYIEQATQRSADIVEAHGLDDGAP